MKKVLALVLALMMLLTSAALAETVTLGATAPLTGSNQMTGGYYVNGMKMAVDEINAAGGILGRELALKVEDEGADQTTALNATVKLIEEGVPAIIGSYFSTNCMAVLGNVKDSGVVYYANGSNPDISAQQNPYVWQIRVTDNFTGPIMASVAVDTAKITNPAILYTTAASTTLLAERVMLKMEEMGYPVDQANVYGAPEEETNFNAIIAQIMASDVDGLMCMGVSEAWNVAFSQQLESAGFDLPKVGSLSFSSVAYISVAGSAAEEWITVAEWSADILGELDFEIAERAIEFEKKYEELYGIPSVSQAAWGYDCVYLFKEAAERAGSFDREAINEAMAQTDMQGAGNYYKIYDDTWHVMSTYTLANQNLGGIASPFAKVTFR